MFLPFHLVILTTLHHYHLKRHHANILYNAHHLCILIQCCIHLLKCFNMHCCMLCYDQVYPYYWKLTNNDCGHGSFYLLYIDLMVVRNLCALVPIISYLIIQISLYDKAAPFGTITKCIDYAGVLILNYPH